MGEKTAENQPAETLETADIVIAEMGACNDAMQLICFDVLGYRFDARSLSKRRAISDALTQFAVALRTVHAKASPAALRRLDEMERTALKKEKRRQSSQRRKAAGG